MTRFVLTFGTAIMALTTMIGGAANAAEEIAVEADQSQMISVSTTPGAVVVGNPTIADVTVQGTKVFVHGRSFGTTNLLVLDLDGNQIANFDVSVKHTPNNAVALFKGEALGARRYSYSCAPNCETELQIGDAASHYEIIMSQTGAKIKLATGTDTAKSEAPPAPQ